MVRREGPKRLKGSRGSGCTTPAGESPVPVSAGAPGSRSTAHAEMGGAEAGRRKPLRREQQRGPQHQVKPAASTDLQGQSRAGHGAAKARLSEPKSGQQRWSDSPGVWGAQRVEDGVGTTEVPLPKRLCRK